MRALIVDDDAGIRWVLDKVLQEEGFEVVQAESLKAAADALEKHSFSLVFLDVYLPDGNGMETLKNGMFSAPVVLLTAETTFDNAAQAYRIGAMEYLPKPFDLDEVRALARRVKPKDEPHLPETAANGEVFIGRSPAMQLLFRTLGKVAASE
ncbi:MAG: response regulator, partial [Mariprofundaceae bacterium]|nr:response regulator [Mariprofundaceae bacterium]